MQQQQPANKLIVWCLDEKDVDDATSFVNIDIRHFQVCGFSVTPSDPPEGDDLWHPRFISGRGFSSRPMVISHATHLQAAVKYTVEHLEQLRSFERIFVSIAPFWYRLCFITAVNQLQLWDRVSVLEASLVGIHKKFLELGDTLLSLRPGLLYGHLTSTVRGGRSGRQGIEEHVLYKKLPPALRYLDHVPRVQLSIELQEALLPHYQKKPGSMVDWNSFEDEWGSWDPEAEVEQPAPPQGM